MQQRSLFGDFVERHTREISFVNHARFEKDIYELWGEIAQEPQDCWAVRFDLWGEDDPVQPRQKWISVHNLTQILIFIEGLRLHSLDVDCHVLLLPRSVRDLIFSPQPSELPSRELVRKAHEKVRFFLLNNFPRLLHERGARTTPSLSSFEGLRTLLGAEVHRRYEYSSTTLPISTLVDDPVENTALSERVANIRNILLNQLYRPNSTQEEQAARKKAERASTVFMFELVKNIYQHAYKDRQSTSPMRGFAVAQIARLPAGRKAQIHKKTFKKMLQARGAAISDAVEVDDAVRFLSIGVSDFGLGLSERVRKDLLARRGEVESVASDETSGEREFFEEYEQWLEKTIAASDRELLLLAATTPYTSKLSLEDLSREERVPWLAASKEGIESALDRMREAESNKHPWEEAVVLLKKGELIRLIVHPAGFGLGYCLVFVAKHFGTLVLNSSNVALTFNARSEASKALQTGEVSLTDALRLLSTNPECLFKITADDLGHAAPFPGTCVTVDVPVSYRWAKDDPEQVAANKREFDTVYAEICARAKAH